jgi:hypothetical protein
VSSRRVCDALRARATAARITSGYFQNGMRPLRAPDAHPDRQRPNVCRRRRNGGRAPGVPSAGKLREAESAEYHRRLLRQIGILLVRRTCTRGPSESRRRPRSVPHLEPGHRADAARSGRAVCVSAALGVARPPECAPRQWPPSWPSSVAGSGNRGRNPEALLTIVQHGVRDREPGMENGNGLVVHSPVLNSLFLAPGSPLLPVWFRLGWVLLNPRSRSPYRPWRALRSRCAASARPRWGCRG